MAVLFRVGNPVKHSKLALRAYLEIKMTSNSDIRLLTTRSESHHDCSGVFP